MFIIKSLKNIRKANTFKNISYGNKHSLPMTSIMVSTVIEDKITIVTHWLKVTEHLATLKQFYIRHINN